METHLLAGCFKTNVFYTLVLKQPLKFTSGRGFADDILSAGNLGPSRLFWEGLLSPWWLTAMFSPWLCIWMWFWVLLMFGPAGSGRCCWRCGGQNTELAAGAKEQLGQPGYRLQLKTGRAALCRTTKYTSYVCEYTRDCGPGYLSQFAGCTARHGFNLICM